jgi:two-component system, chemotaxis family, CheB/CheR fusion protein
MDGVQATRLLKADAELKSIPVVVITASAVKSEEGEIRPLSDGFVKKPVSRVELFSALRHFLKPRVEAEPGAEPGAEPEAETIVAQTVAGLPSAPSEALLDALRQLSQGPWRELCVAPVMGEVRKFALHLEELGRTHASPEVMEYGVSLARQVEQFDMARVPKTLKAFEELLERLVCRNGGSREHSRVNPLLHQIESA